MEAVTPDVRQKYLQRVQRYFTAMELGVPDQVPVRLNLGDVQSTLAGMPKEQIYYRLDKNIEAATKVIEELDLDIAPGIPALYWAGLMDGVGAVYYNFGGHQLPPDTQFQYVEGEYMKAQDYPEFIADPTRWIVEDYLPRIHREFSEPGSFRASVALIKGSQAYAQMLGVVGRQNAAWAENHGVPLYFSGKSYGPFDCLGDKLRGMVGVLTDIHRHPGELRAAADMLVDHVVYRVMKGAAGDLTLPAFMPLHRGALPFLSPQQWQEFYWPSLRRVIEKLWRVGKRVMFYAEADWTPYLERIAELPDRSIVFHVDQTDMRRAHEVLGGRFCLSGNIPGELLAYGTPAAVRDCTKRLIDDCARDGGFILDAGPLVLDPCQMENLRAVVETAREYGRASQPSPPAAIPEPVSAWRHILDDPRVGVCLPWSEQEPRLGEILGTRELVQGQWEMLDELAYYYIWSWIL